MKQICVCIGSACHVKGSYQVIQKLKDLIAKEKMQDKIEIKAAFCLGACGSAVSIKVDDGEVNSINEETTDAFFYEKVLGDGDHEEV